VPIVSATVGGRSRKILEPRSSGPATVRPYLKNKRGDRYLLPYNAFPLENLSKIAYV
jgi:hypothetical protein